MKISRYTLPALLVGVIIGRLLSAPEPEESEPIAKAVTAEAPLVVQAVPVPVVAECKPQTVEDIIEEVAEAYSISPEFITAVIEAESTFDADAVSECGAVGLMQVVPKWHGERMERLGVTDLTDPYQNILCGTDALAELFDKYGEAYTVLMAYNEGEYGTALERAEAGDFSQYATGIIERTVELERLHGKVE